MCAEISFEIGPNRFNSRFFAAANQLKVATSEIEHLGQKLLEGVRGYPDGLAGRENLRIMPRTGRDHTRYDPELDCHLNLFLRKRWNAFAGCAGMTLKGRVSHFAFASGRSAMGGSDHMGR
jgi:hypothetical protein